MITFQKIPPATLNATTGETTGLPQKPVAPTIGAMPIQELHRQILNLAAAKVPLEKVHQAIQVHTEITDKEKAQGIASAVYKIMGAK